VAPLAALIATGLLLTRGSVDSPSGVIALVLFIASASVAWWTWTVPLAAITDGVLIWRTSPVLRATRVHINSIRQFSVDEDSKRLVLELADGQELRLRYGWLATDQLAKLRETLAGLVERSSETGR